MIFDPKLLSKIIHSQLIYASNILGIKNADSTKKEALIPIFIKTVESLSEEEQENLDEKVVTQYNHIVTTFGLDKEPEDEVPSETSKGEPPPAPEPESPEVAEAPGSGDSKPEVETSRESSTEEVSQPTESTAKEVKTMAKKEIKKTASKKEGYSRIQAFADAIKSKKAGKVDALIALANQKYVAKGGKDNLKEAKAITDRGIKSLAAMGFVTLNGDSFKLE